MDELINSYLLVYKYVVKIKTFISNFFVALVDKINSYEFS